MCKVPTQQTYSNSYKDLPPLMLGLKKKKNCAKNKHNDRNSCDTD